MFRLKSVACVLLTLTFITTAIGMEAESSSVLWDGSPTTVTG